MTSGNRLEPLSSRHKVGYEFVLEKISEARLRVFDCLKEVVNHFDPKDGPVFPKPLPAEISLYSEYQPSRNGRH